MYILNPNLGWNAGARSKQVCTGDCQATFRVNSTVVGAVVGFNTQDTSTDYREIKYGLYFKQLSDIGPVVYVYESGVQKTLYSTFTENDVFTIRRVEGVVTYWKQSTLLYTSVIPSVGSLILDSSLYSAGDEVR